MRNSQSKVGRRSALCQLACQLKADNFRHYEVERLAKHAGFGFDSADAPAYNAKTVDHRRMGVGSDERVRVYVGYAVFVFVAATEARYSRLTW